MIVKIGSEQTGSVTGAKKLTVLTEKANFSHA